jgi:hypothetical protein
LIRIGGVKCFVALQHKTSGYFLLDFYSVATVGHKFLSHDYGFARYSSHPSV